MSAVSCPEEDIIVDSLPGDRITVCPMCGAQVPEEAKECPNCEEPFSPDAFNKPRPGRDRASKYLFWTGIVLVLVGGPGIALGSWLYDLFAMDFVVDGNPEHFGWLNMLVATIGIIILVVGIIFLILSLYRMEKQELRDMELGEERPNGDRGVNHSRRK